MNVPVYIGKSEKLNNIRCLKAERFISKGELFESSPVIILEASELEHIDKTALGSYVFDWSEGRTAVALGYGSLFNHSYTPNAKFVRDYDTNTINFYATEDIQKDEEIFIHYNNDPSDKTPLGSEYLNFKY